MQRIRWYGPTLLLLATVVLVMVAAPRLIQNLAYAQTSARIQLVQNGLTESPFLAQLSDSFRKVSQVVEPSVVHISVAGRPQGRAGGNAPFDRNPFEGTPWEEFFDRRTPDGGQDDGRFDEFNAPRTFGNGSGWVYDADGHIVTNNHVVRNAETITVRFVDGAEHEAEVVGRDAATDIAVLKIDNGRLHPATLTPEPVEQGDIVFAFGSPFRFDFSMSMGIVSAKGRSLGIIQTESEGGRPFAGFENFIQTDAAINPGNSGGPLTNIYGQVVGMNTAIASRTGAYNGLGFAIPVDMIVDVVDQIIEEGGVARGFLGIRLPQEDLTAEMARTFGFEGEGVLVADAIAGSPAADAGLRAGDIITEIDGEPIESIRELRFEVAGMRPGTTVEVTYHRADEGLKTTRVTLGRLAAGSTPTRPAAADRGDEMPEGSQAKETLAKLGFSSLATHTEQAAGELDRDPLPGVLIRAIRRGSVAASKRVAPGMVITHVMGNRVEDVDDLAAEIAKLDVANGVRLRVAVWDDATRAYVSLFVFMSLPDSQPTP